MSSGDFSRSPIKNQRAALECIYTLQNSALDVKFIDRFVPAKNMRHVTVNGLKKQSIVAEEFEVLMWHTATRDAQHDEQKCNFTSNNCFGKVQESIGTDYVFNEIKVSARLKDMDAFANGAEDFGEKIKDPERDL